MLRTHMDFVVSSWRTRNSFKGQLSLKLEIKIAKLKSISIYSSYRLTLMVHNKKNDERLHHWTDGAMLIQRNCYIQCKYPLVTKCVHNWHYIITIIVIVFYLLLFSISVLLVLLLYTFFIAIIIDKLYGNLKEYPSFKGKYRIFLSCTYDKF